MINSPIHKLICSSPYMHDHLIFIPITVSLPIDTES
jgi:hypothetical protein